MTHPFEVRNSSIEGKGIFATAPILRGETICVFEGSRFRIPELKRLYESGDERIDDPLQIGNDLYIDLDEPYIFSNHSCTPNAGMRGEAILFALRDIERGEEITYDYSTTECTNDRAWGVNWTDTWRIPCHCGAKHCRGEIRVFSLLPDEAKEAYYQQGALMGFIYTRLAAERSA